MSLRTSSSLSNSGLNFSEATGVAGGELDVVGRRLNNKNQLDNTEAKRGICDIKIHASVQE